MKLSQSNNFKVELSAGHFFKPSVDIDNNYLGYGTNVYDNCGNLIEDCQRPYDQSYFRVNIEKYIQDVYVLPPYKDIIWGYHICEEAAYRHYHHFADNCRGNIWGNSAYFQNVEIPPTNVDSAISYYKNSLAIYGITNHKMIVMEANHYKNINDNTSNTEPITEESIEDRFNPQQYIKLLSKLDSRDVFFEGSYTQFQANEWKNQAYEQMFNNGFHYLGAFKSIDYAKNFVSEVHKVINIEGASSGHPTYVNHYHSNENIRNANWLWFQAYTSIIHGVKGIWFWDMRYSRDSSDTICDFDKINDVTVRYNRSSFPQNYQKFISFLAQEIRFLCDKNIISTDANTIVATKTDSRDLNGIVPDANSYIPSALGVEKCTENYGLRYTIRTNGAETYMIITNPLDTSISVSLDFSKSSNPQIQYSTGVYVLFDNNQYSVNSSNYKVDRNSNIDLINGTVGKQYYVGFSSNRKSNKKLNISFGPLDVKVLKFAYSPPLFNTDWCLIWSNFGSGNINGHKISDNDIFYTGDFDGDGTEELLCVQYTGNSNDWITLLKYIDNNWEWHWSNYGSPLAGNGIYPYRYNFIVGDYDGDGKDELLGNDINGWTTLFKFNNGNWNWIWSDRGMNSHAILPYKDKFYAGDFNGDHKDELLGCDIPNGWTTSFRWDGSNFVWIWSDYGNNHAIRPYRTNLLSGDFDKDGKIELLGFDGWSTLFHFENEDWQWGWSTYGANNFNGWPYPFVGTNAILAGDINSNGQDELLFIQTQLNATEAMIMNLNIKQNCWNLHWITEPQQGISYIGDWPLNSNSGSNTKYFLVKAKLKEPKYLIAMRKFGNNYLVNMYRFCKKYGKSEEEDANKNNIYFKTDNEISVFPNPTDGYIQIMSAKSSITYVDLFDSKGLSIYHANYNSHQKVELDLSKYPKGIYILKIINSQNRIAIHKIIKN